MIAAEARPADIVIVTHSTVIYPTTVERVLISVPQYPYTGTLSRDCSPVLLLAFSKGHVTAMHSLEGNALQPHALLQQHMLLK